MASFTNILIQVAQVQIYSYFCACKLCTFTWLFTAHDNRQIKVRGNQHVFTPTLVTTSSG